MESSDFFFDHASLERSVEKTPELYQGLHPEALYTSLEDLNRIFQHPTIDGVWVDLGCGVGQSVLHYARRKPGSKSIGIEMAPSRIEAGLLKRNELGLFGAELLQGDLLTCEIPVGDVYFLYFPTGPVLDRILKTLSDYRHNFHLVVIESHGDLLERLKEERWLEIVDEIPLHSPRHYPNAVIFQSTHAARPPSYFDFSYQEFYFLIEDETGTWIGDSLGLRYHREGEINLLHPPRTVKTACIKEILSVQDLDPVTYLAVRLRKLGVLTIVTSQGVFTGSLRKIHVKAGLSVEISSGEKIEWEHISSLHFRDHLCFDSSLPHSFSLPAVSIQ